MTSQPGLRERKKLATRAALSHAALHIMIDRGIGAVTPESVAGAVGVSERTFRNYFASREEAILDGVVQRAASLVDAIRIRPAGESAWDSLFQVLPAGFAEMIGEREDIVAVMGTVRENPAMLAQHLTVFERVERLMTEAVAERIGADPDRDLAPRLLAAVSGCALKTALELWAEGGTDATLPDLVRESLTQVRAGLPHGGDALTT